MSRQQSHYGIIGGGLAGGVLALGLNQLGHKVSLWHRPAPINTGHKTPISIRANHKSWLEILGIWPRLSSFCWPINTVSIHYQDHPSPINIAQHQISQPHLAYVCATEDLHNCITQQLKEQKNIEYIEGICQQLTPARQTNDAWHITDSIGGKYHNLSRVFIADGARSPLSARMGMGYEYKGDEWVSCICAIAVDRWPEKKAVQGIASDFIYGMVPSCISKEGWLIITTKIQSEQSHGKRDQYTLQRIQEVSRYMSPYMGTIKSIGEKYYRNSSFFMRGPSYFPGVMAVGQAQFNMPPFGAQAMNRTWDHIKNMLNWQKRAPWHQSDGLKWQLDRHQKSSEQLLPILKQLAYLSNLALTQPSCIMRSEVKDMAWSSLVGSSYVSDHITLLGGAVS